MPFTPFHLGFAVFVYSIFPFLDPIALLLSCVIIDIEPLFYLLFNIGELHGIIHSFLGVIIFFIPVSLISWLCFRWFKLDQYIKPFNPYFSLLSSLLGLVSHIFFDTIIYPEMMFLFPFTKTKGILSGLWSSRIDYIILSVMFGAGMIIILARIFIRKYKKRNSIEQNLLD